MQTWLVLLILILSIAALLFAVTCCAIRCFRNQNAPGGLWKTHKGEVTFVGDKRENVGGDIPVVAVA
jgi:hypothetical protein